MTFADGTPAAYGFGLGRRDRAGPPGHRPWRRAARLAQPPAVRALGARLRRRHVQPPVGRARGGGGRARRRAGRGPAAAAAPGAAAGLARRLYRAGDRACRCASRPPRTGRCACATAISRICSTCSADGTRERRQRAAAARRWRAVDGPPAREPDLAPAPVRRRASHRRRRPLPLRGTGCRADRGRRRRRAVRRLLGLPRPGTHGTARAGRCRMSGCCPARARWTTRRPATGRWRSGATQRAASTGVEVGCWLARRLPYVRSVD